MPREESELATGFLPRAARVGVADDLADSCLIETLVSVVSLQDFEVGPDPATRLAEEFEALSKPGITPRATRPRRIIRTSSLTIRRAKTETGYTIYISGKRANNTLIERMMDEIAGMFLEG